MCERVGGWVGGWAGTARCLLVQPTPYYELRGRSILVHQLRLMLLLPCTKTPSLCATVLIILTIILTVVAAGIILIFFFGGGGEKKKRAANGGTSPGTL